MSNANTQANVALGLTVIIELLKQAQVISDLIQQASAAGRDKFTPEEWQMIHAADDAARQKLLDWLYGPAPAPAPAPPAAP